MQKYGFIYIWLDTKHKRYYVGRHWGTTDDGYICSSRMMRQAHKRRPEDFKRRIVSFIYTNKQDLNIEEQRWLDMIQKEELGKRYYNKTKKSDTPSMLGRKHSKETKQKISDTCRGRQFSDYAKQRQREVMIGRVQSEEEKAKRVASLTGRSFKWKNPGSTKGMMTVVNQYGNILRINKLEFENSLTGTYVTVRSKKGQQRIKKVKNVNTN